ncbi:hypothetical protein MFLAVUS_007561 [Mucor flavus]|uniref:Uncharacterized protein n=1 Tax=Mucor flavus TaxID=439312 RepID=A0ABP9Z4N0_9FUNG
MLAGDRGYRLGSSLKGHLKYGGVWKPKLRSPYASIAITNKYLTSQTCDFLFKKNINPSKVFKTKNGTFVKENERSVSWHK